MQIKMRRIALIKFIFCCGAVTLQAYLVNNQVINVALACGGIRNLDFSRTGRLFLDVLLQMLLID